MKLKDFTVLVNSKFNVVVSNLELASMTEKLGHEPTLTDKYLRITSITSLNAASIDDMLASIDNDADKELLIDKLAWNIPGGAGYGNLDVNEDGKITAEDDLTHDDVIDDADFDKKSEIDIEVEHDYVEIGGVKWATMNVGANAITNYGLYFAWGDTQGYTRAQVPSEKAFSWDDYKYGDGDTFTKYNETDGKTVLDASDDAITAAWGGNWRMPTHEEFQALVNATTNQWTTIDGVSGRLLTSKDDSSKTLFFPAAGYCGGGGVWDVGDFGYYWSRPLYTGDVSNAWNLYFGGGSVDPGSNSGRYQGYSVRGVFVG